MVSVHGLFFHKVSLIALHKQGTCVYMPCRYDALSCSRSQFLTALITYPSVSNFVSRIAPFRAPNRWNMRVVDRGRRVDVLTMPKQILLWLPHSSSKLECSLAEARFLLESCEAEVFRNTSEFYQCPEVDLAVDCLPFWHCIHKNRFFTVPVIMTLPADIGLFFSS